MIFDRIAILDWSAAAAPSPARPSPDAIWIGLAGDGETYHRTRAAAMDRLTGLIHQTLARGERLLIGADFPFGYPSGLAAALTGRPLALSLWDWLAARIEDAPDNRNNRFALAAEINAMFPGIGPFWGRPASLKLPALPERGRDRHGHPFPERRAVEALVPSAQPCWKLYTTGSVGSQALLGIAALARLRAAFPGQVAAWPFEPWHDAPVVLAEVYPSLLATAVRQAMAADPAAIKDALQVRLLAAAFARLDQTETFAPLFTPDAPAHVLAEQGWILGAGHEAAMRDAVARAPSPLGGEGRGVGAAARAPHNPPPRRDPGVDQ
ncbi:MAG: molybdopterin molybdenumtransferase MoeA, partial [Gemmobacter sp.]